MISVCMTAYNGEKFIAEQIASILPQLSDNDELIICDDCSTDSTTSIIQSFSDPRIKLIQNHTNFGINKNIGQALALASGDYLFISDQDDIWLPHKVDTILTTFEENPDVSLIASSVEVIDQLGQLINSEDREIKTAQAPKYRRLASNLLYNQYRGCTIALCRSALQYTLPIPASAITHDWWIGLINDLRGKTYLIDSPLIQYRRHNDNFSPFQRKNKLKIFFMQLYFLLSARFVMFRLLLGR